MRYLLILFILFVGLDAQIQKHHLSVVKKRVAAESYADINFYWGCQNATAEKSAGDTTPLFEDNAAIDNTFGAVGDTSCDFPDIWDRVDFDISSNDIVDPISGRVGFYAYVTTLANGQTFFSAQYDNDNKIFFYYDGSYYRLGYYGTGSGAFRAITTSFSPSLNTWYFVECIWGGDTYTLQVKVDGVDVGNSTDVLPTMSTDPTAMRLGVGGGFSADVHMDQILSSDDPARDLNAIKGLTSFPD